MSGQATRLVSITVGIYRNEQGLIPLLCPRYETNLRRRLQPFCYSYHIGTHPNPRIKTRTHSFHLELESTGKHGHRKHTDPNLELSTSIIHTDIQPRKFRLREQDQCKEEIQSQILFNLPGKEGEGWSLSPITTCINLTR